MSAAAAPAGAAPWKPRHSPWLVTIAVMLATSMEVLDTSIANVSLPHIAGNLSASTDEATWVLTSYLVSNAIVLSAAAWLSSWFGRKRYLAFSVALFVVASALCGMAQSLPQLIVARVLQGIGGGGLQPLAQAIMLECFPPEERGVAMAAYGMGIVVMPIIGPTLGGWITDNYSWRWIFYINLPIGIAGLLMQQAFVEDPPWIAKMKAGAIDYIGFGLMALGIGLFQLVLDKGQESDWFGATWICWSSAVALAALAAFVWWELRQLHPILNLRLLTDRNFAMATVLMTMLGAVLYGSTAILPIFMQTLLGYPALQSGLAMTPRGIGSFLSMMTVGRVIKRVDHRLLMMSGFLGLAVSTYMLSRLNMSITPAHIAWPLVASGFCMGFIFVPLTTLSVSTLRQDQIQQATGLYALLRNLGASVGISVMIALQIRSAQSHQALLVGHATPYDAVYRADLARLAGALRGWSPSAAGAGVGVLYREVLRQAALLSYLDSFRLMTLVCLLCVPFAWVFRLGRKPAGAVMLE
ncbi:MAG: DHA2 family efflux MFS transporter permease subunit [Elusimicrobia bacterium]|nr:DHA2 family efflux MFS transporter permease subunit [Elusimicrobiota bacterium]